MCHKKSPYGKCCFSKKVRAVETQPNDDAPVLEAVQSMQVKEGWPVTLKIGRANIHFKIDTGADVTVLPKELYKASLGKLHSNTQPLSGPGKYNLEVGVVETDIEMDGFVSRHQGLREAIARNTSHNSSRSSEVGETVKKGRHKGNVSRVL